MLRFCSVRLDTLAPILKAMMALLNLDTRCLQRIAFSTHGVIIYLCCNHDKVCIKAKFLQLLENSFVETQNAIKIRARKNAQCLHILSAGAVFDLEWGLERPFVFFLESFESKVSLVIGTFDIFNQFKFRRLNEWHDISFEFQVWKLVDGPTLLTFSDSSTLRLLTKDPQKYTWSQFTMNLTSSLPFHSNVPLFEELSVVAVGRVNPNSLDPHILFAVRSRISDSSSNINSNFIYKNEKNDINPDRKNNKTMNNEIEFWQRVTASGILKSERLKYYNTSLDELIENLSFFEIQSDTTRSEWQWRCVPISLLSSSPPNDSSFPVWSLVSDWSFVPASYASTATCIVSFLQCAVDSDKFERLVVGTSKNQLMLFGEGTLRHSVQLSREPTNLIAYPDLRLIIVQFADGDIALFDSPTLTSLTTHQNVAAVIVDDFFKEGKPQVVALLNDSSSVSHGNTTKHKTPNFTFIWPTDRSPQSLNNSRSSTQQQFMTQTEHLPILQSLVHSLYNRYNTSKVELEALKKTLEEKKKCLIEANNLLATLVPTISEVSDNVNMQQRIANQRNTNFSIESLKYVYKLNILTIEVDLKNAYSKNVYFVSLWSLFSGTLGAHTSHSDVVEVIPSLSSRKLRTDITLSTLQISFSKEPFTLKLFVEWESENAPNFSFVTNLSRRSLHIEFLKSITISLDEIMPSSQPNLQCSCILSFSHIYRVKANCFCSHFGYLRQIVCEKDSDLIVYSTSDNADVVGLIDNVLSCQCKFQKNECETKVVWRTSADEVFVEMRYLYERSSVQLKILSSLGERILWLLNILTKNLPQCVRIVSKKAIDSTAALCQKLLSGQEEEMNIISNFVNHEEPYLDKGLSENNQRDTRDTIKQLLEQLKTLWKFRMNYVQRQLQTDEVAFKLIRLCGNRK
jgi:hypothetical protein